MGSKILIGLVGFVAVLLVLALVGFLAWLAYMTVKHGKLLVPLALRSLATHRVKTLIVGGILGLGTFLLVVGLAALGNIERAMEKGITGSLVGDLQVFAENAKDDVVFYGPQAGSSQDIGVIPDWPKVKESLRKVEGVRDVVPMGRDAATAVGGNELDDALSALRDAVRAGDDAKRDRFVARVRQMVEILKPELQKRAEITSNKEETDKQLAIIEKASSDALWAGLATDPDGTLEFLDTQLAPLQSDAAVTFVAYVGVDIEAFAKNFDRFNVVKGELVPQGERGFMMNQGFYDEFLKNKVARALDLLHEARTIDKKRIADDTTLQEKLRKAQRQYRRVLLDTDPENLAKLEQELRTYLKRTDGTPDELVQAFLQLDDANFDAAYDFFYAKVAPLMNLYKVKVGDTLTVRALTKSGYTKAANLKIWGTFSFKGLEGSLIASRYNLIDLMSFRDLYGLMTPERKKELEAMKAAVGIEEVSRADAEAALFGDDSDLEEAVQEAGGDVAAGTVAPAEETPAKVEVAEAPRRYTQEELDGGVVLHASVLLQKGANPMVVAAKIAEVSKAEGLGIKVIDWRAASGIVGQLIAVLYGILIVILLIIGVVSLVIVNNSILMATMDRIGEVGTMRAIGAGRNLILAMFALESVVLTVMAAAGGATLAAMLVGWLQVAGLPAPSMGNGIFIVLFGGRVLNPVLTVTQVLGGVGIVSVVALVATLYPAFTATRVPPIVAMQRRE